MLSFPKIVLNCGWGRVGWASGVTTSRADSARGGGGLPVTWHPRLGAKSVLGVGHFLQTELKYQQKFEFGF